MINAGQQLSRQEALRLYTAANGWFLKEERSLGTLEVGKLGDVAVLSADYFDAATLPDDAIKTLTLSPDRRGWPSRPQRDQVAQYASQYCPMHGGGGPEPLDTAPIIPGWIWQW